ncbi:MAG: MBL fold metallo-hydrolase [Oscillospiraceae bacterium]|nr:MBL fold metallo-hydrolase [Oscillospiraceae bacterium]
MKKNKKKKIIIFAVIGFTALIAILLNQPIRSVIALTTMKPLETREVLTDIYAVKNSFVNLYLVKTGDKYIAFDAGADEKATKAALDGLGIDANGVAAVFMTHTDGDHAAALPLFSSAEIYMAESNKTFIGENEGQSRSKVFINMGRDYKTMADGEKAFVGGAEIQCIFTPGHTDGSASYIRLLAKLN